MVTLVIPADPAGLDPQLGHAKDYKNCSSVPHYLALSIQGSSWEGMWRAHFTSLWMGQSVRLEFKLYDRRIFSLNGAQPQKKIRKKKNPNKLLFPAATRYIPLLSENKQHKWWGSINKQRERGKEDAKGFRQLAYQAINKHVLCQHGPCSLRLQGGH